MKRGFIVVFLCLIITSLHAKTLIIGTVYYDPPYEMLADQDNHFFGFDIDVMNAICHQLNITCQFKPMYFGELFTAIDEKTIDLAIAGLTITKEREQDYLFSLPYLKTYARFLTLYSSNINTLADLKGKKVGTLKSSIYSELVDSMYPDNMTIFEYTNIDQIVNALGQNIVDAVIGASASIEYWYANNSSFVKMIGGRIPVGSGVGIMANKDSASLIAEINEAIEKIENNGVYLAIYERYFGGEEQKMSANGMNSFLFANRRKLCLALVQPVRNVS